MNTIMIKRNGNCHEFGVEHGYSPDPFLIGIDFETKTAIIHHKSTNFWCGRGESNTAPAELRVISFESFDIGERVSGGERQIFLRSPKLLGEFPTSRATSIKTTIKQIEELIGDIWSA